MSDGRPMHRPGASGFAQCERHAGVRCLRWLGLAIVVVSVAGCSASPDRASIWNPFGLELTFAPTQDPVRVGVESQASGILNPTAWAAAFRVPPWEALGHRLTRELDVPVQFEPMTVDQLAYHLESGRLQFALASRTGYEAIREQGSDCRLIATAVPARRQAVIVAGAGSGVRTLLDVRGKRFAFGWPTDMNLDAATFRCLQEGGVSQDDLHREALPIPGAWQRHADSAAAAREIVYGLGTPCGVIDGAYYDSLPARGGRWALLGATVSRDQLVVLARARAAYVETIDDARFITSSQTAPPLVRRVEQVLDSLHESDAGALAPLGLERFRVPGGVNPSAN